MLLIVLDGFNECRLRHRVVVIVFPFFVRTFTNARKSVSRAYRRIGSARVWEIQMHFRPNSQNYRKMKSTTDWATLPAIKRETLVWVPDYAR